MKRVAILLALLFALNHAYPQFVVENVAQGKHYYDQGDYHLAIQKFLDALTEEPHNGMIHYDLAMCYLAMKEYENALMSIDQAIERIEPDLKEMALLCKGDIFDQAGFFQAAVQFYQKASAANPNSHKLSVRYGMALNTTGKKDEARKIFERAIRKKFDEPAAHRQLAYLMRERQRNVPASLGVYYSLVLDHQSAAASQALFNLLNWMYRIDDTSNASLNITKEEMEAAQYNVVVLETFFKYIALVAASDQNSSETRFVIDTDKYFESLEEAVANPNPKAKASTTPDITMQYIRFFADLRKAGHVEAFCYNVLTLISENVAQEWLTANAGKSEQFYEWLSSYKPAR